MDAERLLPILRCPATGSVLDLREDVLVAAEGGRTYQVANGVPILVDPGQSVFSVEDIAAHDGVVARKSLVYRVADVVLPGRGKSVGTSGRVSRFLAEVRKVAAGRTARVLVVGGGRVGDGMTDLVNAAGVEVVATDVYLSPNVSVVCDGHWLPFVDGAFDGVVIQAVLEHVLDPALVVAEIYRVLAPSGIVYAETPFLQQVHEGPYDFTRWTESGHRRLFRMFSEIDRGATAGPGSVLVWSLRAYARALVPGDPKFGMYFGMVVQVCFSWLRYFDRFMTSRPAGIDGAWGVYFLGAKAESAVSDREIISGYRGAQQQPERRHPE